MCLYVSGRDSFALLAESAFALFVKPQRSTSRKFYFRVEQQFRRRCASGTIFRFESMHDVRVQDSDRRARANFAREHSRNLALFSLRRRSLASVP